VQNQCNKKNTIKAVEIYLSQLLGSGRVPYNYVFHKNEFHNKEAIYETEQEQNVAIAPLKGTSYQFDNATVYGIIQQLVLEGPGYS
jgi:hypothetical protein